MIIARIEEVSPLLAIPGAQICAGGTVVEAGEQLIDISALDGLRFIRERNARIEIGALTRLAEIAAVPEFHTTLSGLREAAESICEPEIPEKGTLGGNLCVPFIGNMACILAALKAVVTLRGDTDYRDLPLERLYDKQGRTKFAFDEWITKVSFPIPAGYYDAEFCCDGYAGRSGRKGTCCALLVQTDEEMRITSARAFTLGNASLQRERELEKMLKGAILNEPLIRQLQDEEKYILFGDMLDSAADVIAAQIDRNDDEDDTEGTGPMFLNENEARNYREYWSDSE